MKKTAPSNRVGVKAYVQANRGLKSNPSTLFNEDQRTDDLSLPLLKNARKSGVLNLAGRNLVNIPAKVWKINDLDESEKKTTLSHSLDNSSEEKWWEFVDLQKLIVANNSIREIPGDIGGLVSLQTLDAHDNQITTVGPEIGSLENLQKLDLSHNKITKLPVEVYYLKRLTELKLNHNHLETLSAEIGQLGSLRQLDISNNKLESLPGDIGFLSFLTNLNISNNNLQDLPADFSGLTGLRTFDASENRLVSVGNIFSEFAHLEILYLQNNRLKAVPDVSNSVNLKELYMQNNQVTEFNSSLFAATKIQLLNFRSNKINKLEVEKGDLELVDRFWLENNDVSVVPNALVLLPALKQLTLEGNPLKGIRVDILQRGTHEILKYLRGKLTPADIETHSSGSNICESKVITPRGARGASSEKELGIDVHKLKSNHTLALVSKSITALEDHIFVTAAQAQVNKIDLSRNLITELPITFADVCEFLNELVLDFNRFTHLPPCIGQSCTRLQFLSFQNNQVAAIPEDFSNLKQLREINFGYNKFESIPSCLDELPCLELIMGTNNKINIIDPEQLKKMKCLSVLDLSNNNINQLPPQLGLLNQLKSLKVEGNTFRVPGYAVLAQGTDSILRYLRNRIVPE